MSVLSIWASVKTAAGAGILQGGYPFARNVYMVGDNVPTYAQSKATVAAALADVVSGDIILLGNKTFQEGNLSLAAGKNNITIIGMGNYGACRIESVTAGDEGLNVLADDCTLINVSLGCPTGGDYALKVGSASVKPLRFRAFDSRFYGPTGANPAGAVVMQGALDATLDGCEILSCSNGILLALATADFVKNLYIRKCRFHAVTTVHIGNIGGAVKVTEGLEIDTNLFGTPAPTDFILLSDNGNTGTIKNNSFAINANLASVITIGTGLIYPTNYTEAGPSTARPA